jgi:hypothetical protein
MLVSLEAIALALALLFGCKATPNPPTRALGGPRFFDGRGGPTRTDAKEVEIGGRRLTLTTFNGVVGGRPNWTLQIIAEGAYLGLGSNSPATSVVDGTTIVFGAYRLVVSPKPGEFSINGKTFTVRAGLHYMLSPYDGVIGVSIM